MNKLVRWDYLLLGVLMLVYVSVLGTLSIGRHDAFASGYDLSNVDSTAWNTINGNLFQLTDAGAPISRFAYHADLIIVLLSPLYLLWDNVRMLILAESVFLALGAIPTYLLSMRILKNKVLSFVLVLLYLINPGMQWTDIYDFHGVSMAITFLLFAFYFSSTKKWRWFALFIFLALITKEQISLSVAMLGLTIAFVFKERKIGFATFVIGCIWFVAMVFIVMPYFSPSGKHWALAWYQFDSNASVLDSIPSTSVILNKFILAPDSLPYYKSLLSPFGFLSLLGLPWLILALPELTVNMLSSHGQMRSIVLHYDSGVTPWIVIASIFGVYYLQKFLLHMQLTKKHAQQLLYALLVIPVLIAVRFNYHYSPLPTTPSCWCFMYQPSEEDKAFEKLLQEIPQDASVTASPEIRPHITHRRYAYTLPAATASADFIALIDQNRIVGNYEPKEFELVLRDQLNEGSAYSLVKHTGHFYLYKRNK